MICTTIQHHNLEEILGILENGLPAIGMAEIRLDRCPLDENEIETLFSASDTPLVATCRVAGDGSGTWEEAEVKLLAAIRAGASFADLEIEAPKETGKKIALNDAIFAIEPNDHAIYLDVKQFLAAQRQGTAKAKQRSENAHSTRKLGPQKGGGGARPGDLKSPIRVGGGTIFGPVPRDYDFKLNKKVKQLARKSALSLRAKQNELLVLDALNFDAPKTKAMVEVLNALQVAEKKVLFVVTDANLNARKSAANIQRVNVVNVNELNTYTIMNSNVVVLTEASAAAIEATLNA